MLFHNHALFKTAPGYELYRSLHLGTRGPAGSEYVLIRLADGRQFDYNTQKEVKVHFNYNGINIDWVSNQAWQEIKHG